MSGFLKILSKKNPVEREDSEPSSPNNIGYYSMETTSLKKLSSKELYRVIYRYDHEVTGLNKQLEETGKMIERLQGQLDAVAVNKGIEESFVGKLQLEIREHKKELKAYRATTEALSAGLKERDSVIKTHKKQLDLLNFKLSGNKKTEETDTGNDITALSLKIEVIIKEKYRLYAKLKAEQGKIAGFIAERDDLALEVERRKSHLQAFEAMIATLNESFKQTDTYLVETREKLSRKKAELKTMKSSHIPSLQAESDSLRTQLAAQAKLLRSKAAKFTAPGTSSTPRSATMIPQSPLFQVKLSLSKLYKSIMQEINKSSDGNTSIYSLASPSFTDIERKLNDLISLVDDNIQSGISLSEQQLSGEKLRRTHQKPLNVFTKFLGMKSREINNR